MGASIDIFVKAPVRRASKPNSENSFISVASLASLCSTACGQGSRSLPEVIGYTSDCRGIHTRRGLDRTNMQTHTIYTSNRWHFEFYRCLQPKVIRSLCQSILMVSTMPRSTSRCTSNCLEAGCDATVKIDCGGIIEYTSSACL